MWGLRDGEWVVMQMIIATGYLYTVLTAGPAGRTRVADAFARRREDDRGSGPTPATTAAKATTTVDEERPVRDVVRLTMLQALKTTVVLATMVTEAWSERPALRLYRRIRQLGEKRERICGQHRNAPPSWYSRCCRPSFPPAPSCPSSSWPRRGVMHRRTLERFVSSSPALLTSAFLVIRHSPAVSSIVSVAAATSLLRTALQQSSMVPSMSAPVPPVSVVVSSLSDRSSRAPSTPSEGFTCRRPRERDVCDPVALLPVAGERVSTT